MKDTISNVIVDYALKHHKDKLVALYNEAHEVPKETRGLEIWPKELVLLYQAWAAFKQANDNLKQARKELAAASNNFWESMLQQLLDCIPRVNRAK